MKYIKKFEMGEYIKTYVIIKNHKLFRIKDIAYVLFEMRESMYKTIITQLKVLFKDGHTQNVKNDMGIKQDNLWLVNGIVLTDEVKENIKYQFDTYEEADETLKCLLDLSKYNLS